MDRPPPRANCFDASALVKVFSSEEGGESVREYFNQRSPTKYTTPFCFYETLSVLKVKWLYRKQMTKVEYNQAAFQLVAWYGAATRHGTDIDFREPKIFLPLKRLLSATTLTCLMPFKF
jgi:predicted nucleic acid-binding protein